MQKGSQVGRPNTRSLYSCACGCGAKVARTPGQMARRKRVFVNRLHWAKFEQEYLSREARKAGIAPPPVQS